jgi:hypothetical protein
MYFYRVCFVELSVWERPDTCQEACCEKPCPCRRGFGRERPFNGLGMAKSDRTGRTSSLFGRFVALPHYLLTCPAWRSLGPVERCAYIEVLYRYNGCNNGRLAISARILARELHISRTTATRALNQLCKHGLLEVRIPGSFSCKVKRATEYRLTHFRCDVTGVRPSKAFMRWQPERHLATPQNIDPLRSALGA